MVCPTSTCVQAMLGEAWTEQGPHVPGTSSTHPVCINTQATPWRWSAGRRTARSSTCASSGGRGGRARRSPGHRPDSGSGDLFQPSPRVSLLGLVHQDKVQGSSPPPRRPPGSPSSQPNTTPGPACPRCITAPARQPQSDFTTIPRACLPPQPVAPGITPPARAPSAMFYLTYHDHAMSARFSPDPSRAMRDAPPRSCGDPPCNRHADCWMELR